MNTQTVCRLGPGIPPLRPAFLCAVLLLVAVPGCGRGRAAPDAKDQEPAVGGGEQHADTKGGTVTLDSAQVRMADISLAAVGSVMSSALPVTGTITYDPNRVSHIGSRTEGRISALRADIGDRVQRGATLALLESPAVGQLRSEEEEGVALLQIAQENYEREERLEQQGISSRKEFLQAKADLRRAEAALRSTRERLRVLGAAPGHGAQFALTAPFAGVVVARDASLGEMAGPQDRLFTVADLSRVWIQLSVFERDLSRVAKGQPVSVTTTAYPDRTFPGRIVYVGAVLDSTTRTVEARVEIMTPRGELRPGMFATATVQVGQGGQPRPVLPREAVQEVDGRTVVFVPGDRPGEFRVQAIELDEPVDSMRVAVRAGVAPGDTVVVSGAFLLRSELAKGEIGEHGH